jgi:hypothetical protein
LVLKIQRSFGSFEITEDDVRREAAMSFETVERLKQDYTDKWVTVDTATPELRRFVGLSGQIKTVNMNGRALVQFDNPVDISWYDIDLSYLKVINAPIPKKSAEKHAEPAEKKAAAPVAKPAVPGGKSPLELAREQAAAKAAGASAPVAATAPAGDKPLSKLDIARQQAAAAKARAAGGVAPAAAPAVEAVATAAEPAAPAPVVATPAPATPAAAPAAVMVDENGKPLSKLEMARRQGAAKKPQ